MARAFFEYRIRLTKIVEERNLKLVELGVAGEKGENKTWFITVGDSTEEPVEHQIAVEHTVAMFDPSVIDHLSTELVKILDKET